MTWSKSRRVWQCLFHYVLQITAIIYAMKRELVITELLLIYVPATQYKRGVNPSVRLNMEDNDSAGSLLCQSQTGSSKHWFMYAESVIKNRSYTTYRLTSINKTVVMSVSAWKTSSNFDECVMLMTQTTRWLTCVVGNVLASMTQDVSSYGKSTIWASHDRQINISHGINILKSLELQMSKHKTWKQIVLIYLRVRLVIFTDIVYR